MTDAGPVPIEPPPGMRRRSYIARHWRGELSLPVSYFVNGMAIGFVSLVLIATLGPLIPTLGTPVGVLAGIVGIWMLALGITVWQGVGIWRAADNHPSRGGSKGWAIVAKVLTVIGLLQAAYLFGASGIPQVREGIRIVRGDASMGEHTVRLLNNGTELELAGGITYGVANEIERALDENSSVHTVHLNSIGGRIGEAENIRNLIERHGLDTYVAAECLSACTIAFLGGERRFIDPDAKLGFHAGTYPGVFENDLESFNRSLVESAIDRGVDPAFAEKAYLSDSEEFWKPEHAELIAAGFVTEISNGQFAVSGFGVNFTPDDVAIQLRTVPLFDAVASVEPSVFGQVVQLFYDGALTGTPLGEITASGRMLLGNVLLKYVPQASSQRLLEMGQLLIEELRILEATDADACFSFLYPAMGGAIDLRNYVPPELWQRDLDLTEKLILSGASNEAQHEPPGDSQKAFNESLARIIDRHGAAVMTDIMALSTDLAGMDHARVCRTILIIYEAILELPPAEAATLMRDILSQAPQP